LGRDQLELDALIKYLQSFPTSLVHATALSPDGKQLITFNLNGRGEIWNADTGRQLRTIESLGHTVQKVEFSPDGRSLLIVANQRGKIDSVVMVRDVSGGKVRLTLENTKTYLNVARFSPDGRRILTGFASDLLVWDAETGQTLYALKETAGSAVNHVEFGPDGTLLAQTWGGGIVILDGGTGRPLRRLVTKTTDHTKAVTFLPDGSRVFLAPRLSALTPDGTRTVIGDLPCFINLADQPAFKPGDDGALREWFAEQTRTDYIRGEIGRIWDLRTGRYSASVSDPKGPRRSWPKAKTPRMLPIAQNDAAVFDLAHARTLGFLKGHGKVYQQPKQTIWVTSTTGTCLARLFSSCTVFTTTAVAEKVRVF
jgi:WD40 repeat protein